MTDADKKEFLTLMMGVAENFTAQLSKPGIAMRFDALREYPIEQVRETCAAIVRARKFLKMPTVAEFMEFLGGGSAEDIGAVEAAKVLHAVKSIGGYRSVAFDNPVTQAVVEYTFGGWVKLCGELTADTEKWFLKDFVKSYGAYSRQGIQHVGTLAGRTEIGNGARGLAHKAQVALVGDQQKALAIAQSGEGQERVDSPMCIGSGLAELFGRIEADH
jgi:hypothetical protein